MRSSLTCTLLRLSRQVEKSLQPCKHSFPSSLLIDSSGPTSIHGTFSGFRSYGSQIQNPNLFACSRSFSQAAAVETDSNDGEVLAEEEKKVEEVIKAVPRLASGKIISKKERRAGRVPSIVFGQENGHLGGDKQLLAVETKQIERMLKKMGKSFFLSRTFDLEIYDDADQLQSTEKVLPRSDVSGEIHMVCKIHLHSGTDKIMNVTFIRAPPQARLKVDVPLVFIGDDACPGLRKGGYIYTMMRTVKYYCPGDAIPPFIEVDLSTLDMGHKILLKDLKAGPGLNLFHKDSSLPVCKMMGSRTSAQVETPK